MKRKQRRRVFKQFWKAAKRHRDKPKAERGEAILGDMKDQFGGLPEWIAIAKLLLKLLELLGFDVPDIFEAAGDDSGTN